MIWYCIVSLLVFYITGIVRNRRWWVKAIKTNYGETAFKDKTINRRVWKRALLWFLPFKFVMPRTISWEMKKYKNKLLAEEYLQDPTQQLKDATHGC